MVTENHHDCEQIYFTIEVFFSQEDSVFLRFSSGFFMPIARQEKIRGDAIYVMKIQQIQVVIFIFVLYILNFFQYPS